MAETLDSRLINVSSVHTYTYTHTRWSDIRVKSVEQLTINKAKQKKNKIMRHGERK